MSISQTPFGTSKSGQEITKYTCTNKNGYSVDLIDYGATVTSVVAPDRMGKFENIVLGCDDIDALEENTCYFGSTVGRVCNRIGGAKFSIGETEYSLDANNGPNHLHGGLIGFDKLVWQGEPVEQNDAVGVRFKLTSNNGDQGYPGKLEVTATYMLTDDNQLSIEFEASTSETTHVNLTNHCYWNLSGASDGSIRTHELTLNAEYYLSVDETSIPTGELKSVESSPLDFRSPKPMGRDFDSLTNDPTGYDHCYIVSQANAASDLQLAAAISDPKSGRRMEVSTTQPSVQFYTGNYLDGQPTSGWLPTAFGILH